MTGELPTAHPAWLPDDAFRALGSRRVAVVVGTSDSPVLGTVRAEVAEATARWGGALLDGAEGADGAELVLELDEGRTSSTSSGPRHDPDVRALESFEISAADGVLRVTAGGPAGLLYGLHHVVRAGESAFGDAAFDGTVDGFTGRHVPQQPVRMLDHWDNLSVHPVMGQVERGYAGGSIFWSEGRLREDLSRVAAYARLLGSIGINRVAVNNVNVEADAARLITDGIEDLARLADLFRPHGVRTHVSVSFAAPMTVGGLPTADPLDPDVRQWWADIAERLWARIPDFGGFVVKADSEGQPGPFAYGRNHADGANRLAAAVAPHGGLVFWRAFVYDHKQDWRDRSTDRARAAYDHFALLDGTFDDAVVLQVKHGPLDFQTREAVSPVIAAMPRTRLAVELQVTQEYTGHQKHVCYLGPWWSQILRFGLWGEDGPTVADVASGEAEGPAGGLVAVSNVGTDEFWTGHPLAQANLYAYGRLTWDGSADPAAVLNEWIGLTFGPDEVLRDALHSIMECSWQTYEDYTAPLGVGFMVTPGSHYGPSVDGYEYSPWGTYHFADRDGIGVDRTRATGTGYTGQYPTPWRDVYESVETCPDELLLFFHHVPWTHVLHNGVSVAQHVYDTHFRGVEAVKQMAHTWAAVVDRVAERDPALAARVTERLVEQQRSAVEWRDQINTYVWRKSGVPDAEGRTIY